MHTHKTKLNFEKEMEYFVLRVHHFNNYVVTRDGLVINMKTGKRLKPDINNTSGYPRVMLYNDTHTKKCYIHDLVATAFLPNPEGKLEIDHKNHIRTDNRMENLQWATHSENAQNKCLSIRNTSGYQGVIKTKYNTWKGQIYINHKEKTKTFKSIDDAIKWRSDMVRLHYPARPLQNTIIKKSLCY